MDITIAKTDLATLLSRASAVASSKSPTQALTCVLLEADGESVTARATNLMLGYETSAAANVKERGSVAIDAKRAAEISRVLPAGDVRLRVVKNQLEIASGKYKSKLGIYPAEDFPTLPSLSDAKHVATIVGSDLIRIVTAGSYAALADDGRPAQGSTLLTFDQDGIRSFSAERGRMAMAFAACDVAKSEWPNALVPESGISELKDFAKTAKADAVILSRTKSLMFLSCGRRVLSVKLGDDIFPPVQKVMDLVLPVVQWVTADRASLHAALQRVSLTPRVHAGAQSLVMTFSGDIGEIVISGENGSNEGSDSVNCDGAPNLRIEANPKFLIDAVASVVDDEIQIGVTSPTDPLAFRGRSDTTATLGIVMPMRQD